jgi:CheY-like chemotaxis protein
MAQILVIEDQDMTLEVIEAAVKCVFGKETSYDVARSWNEAVALIEQRAYNLVLIDHRIPYDHVAGLERKDIRAYSDTLEDMGYQLIPKIIERNPTVVVVGTSSLKGELRGLPKPHHTMRKMWGEAEEDLRKIVEGLAK